MHLIHYTLEACIMYHIYRVGQNRINAPYMTVHLVISLPKIPYIHRIYMVLANPNNTQCRYPTRTWRPCMNGDDRTVHSRNHCPQKGAAVAEQDWSQKNLYGMKYTWTRFCNKCDVGLIGERFISQVAQAGTSRRCL